MFVDGATIIADDHDNPDIVPKAAQTKLVLAAERRLVVMILIVDSKELGDPSLLHT